MNVLLSYNEWVISVVFEVEQESVYKYTLKDGEIVQSGVSGTTDVKDLKHLDVDKLIYGDMSVSDELGLKQEDMIIANPLKVNESPELVVVCGEEQITAMRGTYSWIYKNEDSTYTGVESDSTHPLESKDYMPDLPLAYSYKSSIDSFKAHFQFGIVPDEVEVRFWSTEYWNMPSEESDELEVQVVEVDDVDGNYSTNYSARLRNENNVYEVIAKWTNSKEYSGTVYYSFYTVIGDYEIVPIGE